MKELQALLLLDLQDLLQLWPQSGRRFDIEIGFFDEDGNRVAVSIAYENPDHELEIHYNDGMVYIFPPESLRPAENVDNHESEEFEDDAAHEPQDPEVDANDEESWGSWKPKIPVPEPEFPPRFKIEPEKEPDREEPEPEDPKDEEKKDKNEEYHDDPKGHEFPWKKPDNQGPPPGAAGALARNPGPFRLFGGGAPSPARRETRSSLLATAPWALNEFKEPPPLAGKDHWEGHWARYGWAARAHRNYRQKIFHPLHRAAPYQGEDLEPLRVTVGFSEDTGKRFNLMDRWDVAPSNPITGRWCGWTFFRLRK